MKYKNKTYKKCQGLSMNMIVLAILALLILVVLSFVFTGQTIKWKKTLNDCVSKGGDCVPKNSCSTQGGSVLDLDCYTEKTGVNNQKTIVKAGDKVCCKLGCESQGGKCESGSNGVCGNGIDKTLYYTNCDKIGKICCLQ